MVVGLGWCPCCTFLLFFSLINTGTLKFKRQLKFLLLTAVNHLSWPLKKENLLLWVQKFMVCDWWISIHFVCFCVSGFVACDHYKRQLRLQQRRMQFFILSWLLNSRVCVLLEIAVTAMQLLSLRWITPVKLSAIHTHLESTSFYKMLPNWTWEYIVLTVCSVLVHWGLIIFFEFSKDFIRANHCTCTCKYHSLCLP